MDSLRVRLQTRAYLAIVRWRRAMTLGVRGAVFDNDGRVFLVRHSYVPGWYFPGGGIERGETAEASLTRELLEEGGIELTAAPELFGLYLNRKGAGRDHVAVYLCRAWRQPKPPRVPNAEIVECGFFSPAALPPDATDATRRRLDEIAGRLPRSAEW